MSNLAHKRTISSITRASTGGDVAASVRLVTLAGNKMNEKLQIELPDEIPPELESRAIELSHLHVAEVAWLRKDVMEIIRQLKGTKVAILGGDVLQKRSDKFEYAYSNWAVDRQSNESPEAYAERSLEEAELYVRHFPDPDNGSVAYVLVFEKGNCQPSAQTMTGR